MKSDNPSIRKSFLQTFVLVYPDGHRSKNVYMFTQSMANELNADFAVAGENLRYRLINQLDLCLTPERTFTCTS